MAMVAREAVEEREDWVATFELVESPGQFRCLMTVPIVGDLYWWDVNQHRMPWRWGVTSLYEGHTQLREFIDEGHLKLIAGVLPWEVEEKPLAAPVIDEERVTKEALFLLQNEA